MNHLELINAAIEDAREHLSASSIAPVLSDLERVFRHAQDLAGELSRLKLQATEDASLDTKYRRQFQNRCTAIEQDNARLLLTLEAFAGLVALLVGPSQHVVGCAVLEHAQASCTGTCAEVHRVMRQWSTEVERALRLAEQREKEGHS